MTLKGQFTVREIVDELIKLNQDSIMNLQAEDPEQDPDNGDFVYDDLRIIDQGNSVLLWMTLKE